MHEALLIIDDQYDTPKQRYAAIEQAALALVSTDCDAIAAMANITSLLYHSVPHLNWCGFYRVINNVLVLGPFQGKPACVSIPIGQGVCGTAAAKRRSIIVGDVTTYPGHIACDPESRSELVIPLLHNNRLLGVLDLDSPLPQRFTSEDAYWLERIVASCVVPFWR